MYKCFYMKKNFSGLLAFMLALCVLSSVFSCKKWAFAKDATGPTPQDNILAYSINEIPVTKNYTVDRKSVV